MIRLIIKIFCGATISLILFACSSQSSQTATTIQKSFANSSADIEVELKTFHLNTSKTRVYVKFKTDKLLYARTNGKEPTATLLIEMNPIVDNKDESFNPTNKKIRISDTDPEKRTKTLVAHTDIELASGSDYLFEIICTDVNRGVSSKKNHFISKTIPNDRENFIAFEDSIEYPLFSDRVKPNTTYNIQLNRSIKRDSISVLYYDRSFKLPPPPFILYEPEPFDYQPEMKYKYPVDSNGVVAIKTGVSGFYHISLDPSQKAGYTLFVSSAEFPEIQKSETMTEAFRFLVGGKEFKSVQESVNSKKQIETFWIDWAGNKDRARKCIKAFYTGVEESNTHFSSHVEGWKSDRGLIYIIYGKPNKVYRTEVSESWIYGEENNPLSITFDFIKVNNPFTENDFRLNRDEIYKPSWYRSVNAWRDGRIY